MAAKVISDGWKDLVEELQQLEAFFPLIGRVAEQDELGEEIAELEALITMAGEPDDEHSLQALRYLQNELVKKRGLLRRAQQWPEQNLARR